MQYANTSHQNKILHSILQNLSTYEEYLTTRTCTKFNIYENGILAGDTAIGLHMFQPLTFVRNNYFRGVMSIHAILGIWEFST